MRTFGRGPVQPSRVCVCASTSRLRLTPEMFLMQLREGHAFSHAIRPSMQVILEWVASADIAEWLVPEPDYVEPAHCTFRDSELVLCLLEVQSHDRPMIPKLPSSSLLGLKLGVRGPLTVTPTVSSTQERNACKPYLRVSHCLSLTAPLMKLRSSYVSKVGADLPNPRDLRPRPQPITTPSPQRLWAAIFYGLLSDSGAKARLLCCSSHLLRPQLLLLFLRSDTCSNANKMACVS